MLGHNFTISAEVVYGNKIGRTIGFPTANQNYPEDILEIPYGVYKVDTNFGKGIANFGIKPTINGNDVPVLETHILNFDTDIYNQVLTVKFIEKIRNEIKFNSLEDLKSQIQKDLTNF